MDANVSFDKQIVNNVAPVVLLSTFLVKHEHVEEFLAGFRNQFAIMRKQPGLISAQLHRGIAGSSLLMNYVIRESTDAFKHGFKSPEFQAQSIVQQVVGNCKTEASQKPVPLHDYLISALRGWRRRTPFRTPEGGCSPVPRNEEKPHIGDNNFFVTTSAPRRKCWASQSGLVGTHFAEPTRHFSGRGRCNYIFARIGEPEMIDQHLLNGESRHAQAAPRVLPERCVIVVDKDLPIGHAANAAAAD
jgi:heme-degrading monooxygenase HmoA